MHESLATWAEELACVLRADIGQERQTALDMQPRRFTLPVLGSPFLQRAYSNSALHSSLAESRVLAHCVTAHRHNQVHRLPQGAL